MDPFTIIMGIGLVLSAIGTGVQVASSIEASQASQRAEQLRKQQMQLDIARKKREAIRQAQFATARGQAAAVSQGASLSDSSVIGASSTAKSAGSENLVALTQNEALGSQMFDANAKMSEANGIGAIGSGMSSWGSSLVNNAGTISRIGSSYGLWRPSASEA
jgi:hypothetical protein